jgi:hypothetical protein
MEASRDARAEGAGTLTSSFAVEADESTRSLQQQLALSFHAWWSTSSLWTFSSWASHMRGRLLDRDEEAEEPTTPTRDRATRMAAYASWAKRKKYYICGLLLVVALLCLLASYYPRPPLPGRFPGPEVLTAVTKSVQGLRSGAPTSLRLGDFVNVIRDLEVRMIGDLMKGAAEPLEQNLEMLETYRDDYGYKCTLDYLLVQECDRPGNKLSTEKHEADVVNPSPVMGLIWVCRILGYIGAVFEHTGDGMRLQKASEIGLRRNIASAYYNDWAVHLILVQNGLSGGLPSDKQWEELVEKMGGRKVVRNFGNAVSELAKGVMQHVTTSGLDDTKRKSLVQ